VLYSRSSSKVYICVTGKVDAIHPYLNYNIVAIQKQHMVIESQLIETLGNAHL
jgi:hypothetical protein